MNGKTHHSDMYSPIIRVDVQTSNISVQIALQLHITPEINSVHQTQWQSLTSYDIKNNITVLGSIIKDGKSKRWQTCVPCQHGKMLISVTNRYIVSLE